MTDPMCARRLFNGRIYINCSEHKPRAMVVDMETGVPAPKEVWDDWKPKSHGICKPCEEKLIEKIDNAPLLPWFSFGRGKAGGNGEGNAGGSDEKR